MSPLFVSFFTPAYAAEAAGLVESLDAFGLPHDVRKLDSRGSWVANCACKPAFIREMRAEHPGRPIVWLDADARVKAPPVLFDTLAGFDFACHYRGGEELLSGTLFFGPTDTAYELLRAWEQECRFFPNEWDQKRLEIAVSRVPGLKAYTLPPTYVRIFDAQDMGDAEDAVVIHRQASRRLRHSPDV